MFKVSFTERVTSEQGWNQVDELVSILPSGAREFQAKRIASAKYFRRYVLEMAIEGL